MNAHFQRQQSAVRQVRLVQRKRCGRGGRAMSIAWCVIRLLKRWHLIPHDPTETQRRAPGAAAISISAFRKKCPR